MNPGDRNGGGGDVLILSGSLVLTLASPRRLMVPGTRSSLPVMANGRAMSTSLSTSDGAAPASTLGPEERILLSLVDGRRTISDLIPLSGLPSAVVRDHLRALFERGVVIPADAAQAVPQAVPEADSRETETRSDEVLGSTLRGAPGGKGNQNQNQNQPFRVGSYEVATRIGRGGMGSIYVCRRVDTPGFQRLFALKVVRQRSGQEEAALRSLLHEGRIGGLMAHPNLQSVVDMGTYKDQPFLVLDYVEGASFADLLGEGRRLPPAVVVSVLLDVLRGLAAMHSTVDPEGRSVGLVHCDVSPPNILVGIDGAARLSDFGSARFIAHESPPTPVPSAAGRPAYMAPEQICGEPIDARTDIFAVGIVMWRALTGQDLFTAETHDQTKLNVLRKKVAPPSAVGAPASLDGICLRALSRSPGERYATAEEMSDVLLKVATTTNLVAPPRWVGQLVRDLFGDVIAEQRRRTQAVFGAAGASPSGELRPARLDTGRGQAFGRDITAEETAGPTAVPSTPAAAKPAARATTGSSTVFVSMGSPQRKRIGGQLRMQARYVAVLFAAALLVGTLTLVILRFTAGPARRGARSDRGPSPAPTLTTEHAAGAASAPPERATAARP